FRLFKPGEREWWTNATVSPMIDLAHLQIEHYQQSSNLKHILEQAAFPMLSGDGVSPQIGEDGKAIPVRVGPAMVAFAPPIPGTSILPAWRFIEPAGTSIEKLQNQVDKIEEQMERLGKAPLIRPSGSLTATTSAVNAAKAHAAAEAWASDEKDALEQCLELTCKWIAEGTRPDVYIHTDFGVELRESNENAELMTAHDKRDISRDTMWDEWRRRGFLGPQFDPDVEKQRIAQELKDDIAHASNDAKAGLMPGPGGLVGHPTIYDKNESQDEKDQLGTA